MTSQPTLSNPTSLEIHATRRWALSGLEKVVEHLLATHHAFTRASLLTLGERAADARARPGGARATVEALIAQIEALRTELEPCFMREERELFPYVIAMARAAGSGGLAPHPMFRTMTNPVRLMTAQHATAGMWQREARALSSLARASAHGSAAVLALCDAFDALDRELEAHILLEENVLMPRAIVLEAALRGSAIA